MGGFACCVWFDCACISAYVNLVVCWLRCCLVFGWSIVGLVVWCSLVAYGWLCIGLYCLVSLGLV